MGQRLMPYTSKVVDELCFIKSMYTEQINHDPATTFFKPATNYPAGPALDPG
jgi:hypothetical protein